MTVVTGNGAKTVVGIRTSHVVDSATFQMGDTEVVHAKDYAKRGLPGPGSKFVIDGKQIKGVRSFNIHWGVDDVALVTVERYVMVGDSGDDT